MAYVHRRLMDEKKPIPVVPVFLNTYFPPNQPRPRRCYELGIAIRQAVESFAGDARVGVIASGGLSHFLVDEDFDRAILKACAGKDTKFLQNLPRNKLHAGSSEILNWVGVAGAFEHLESRLVRICARLPHASRHRHRIKLRQLGVIPVAAVTPAAYSPLTALGTP